MNHHYNPVIHILSLVDHSDAERNLLPRSSPRDSYASERKSSFCMTLLCCFFHLTFRLVDSADSSNFVTTHALPKT